MHSLRLTFSPDSYKDRLTKPINRRVLRLCVAAAALSATTGLILEAHKPSDECIETVDTAKVPFTVFDTPAVRYGGSFGSPMTIETYEEATSPIDIIMRRAKPKNDTVLDAESTADATSFKGVIAIGNKSVNVSIDPVSSIGEFNRCGSN